MIEINNLTACRIDKKLLQDIAKSVLKGENKKELDVSIAFVGKKEIRRLNKKYRKKDKSTDVLSFWYGDSGEIVICPEMTESRQDLVRVLIHGLLHLAGYDHEKSSAEAKKMLEKEDFYAKP